MERNRKTEIRTEVKKRRANATPEVLHEASLRIKDRFTGLEAYRKADVLLAYVDAKREVETRLLMQQAWKDGKQVAAPRVDGDGIMHYYYRESLEELESGSFGIMEPGQNCPLCETEEGLLLMPGVAFDESCHRVGYGGGYYDRYLPQTRCPTMLLCRHQLERSDIPVDGHDVQLDYFVTERGVVRCKTED